MHYYGAFDIVCPAHRRGALRTTQWSGRQLIKLPGFSGLFGWISEGRSP